MLEDFQKELQKLPTAQSLEQLMASEGHTREKYYSTFDTIIHIPILFLKNEQNDHRTTD